MEIFDVSISSDTQTDHSRDANISGWNLNPKEMSMAQPTECSTGAMAPSDGRPVARLTSHNQVEINTGYQSHALHGKVHYSFYFNGHVQ